MHGFFRESLNPPICYQNWGFFGVFSFPPKIWLIGNIKAFATFNKLIRYFGFADKEINTNQFQKIMCFTTWGRSTKLQQDQSRLAIRLKKKTKQNSRGSEALEWIPKVVVLPSLQALLEKASVSNDASTPIQNPSVIGEYMVLSGPIY